MNSKDWKILAISAVGAAILYLGDQYTKRMAIIHLKDQPSFVLIPGVLELKYLENRGAAFGILQDQQFLFGIMTVIFLAAAVYFFWKVPKRSYYYPLIAVAAMLTAGALGNFYDRLVRKYVVDFIYFSLIDYPIFNVADIYVVVSVILLFLLSLFYYKEQDYAFLALHSKNKKQE